MFDLFREIGQTINTNRVRTVLTGVAVAWGIFMLVVLLSMARGVTSDFESGMESERNVTMHIYSGITSVPFKGNREGRRIYLTEKDLDIVPAENQHYVKNISTRLSGGESISSQYKKINREYEGVFPSAEVEDRLTMDEGRFINDRDIHEKSKVMVVPRYYAEILFPPDGSKALGSRVSCNDLSFRIIGIYESRWNRTLFIPFSTAYMMAKDKDNLGEVTVALRNMHTEEDGHSAEQGVKTSLANAHNFDPSDENAIFISNHFLNSLKAQKAISILNLSVWILGILTLLTGIVGVSNIMFVTVKERTHEIGIRRAIGAKPLQILIQIIAESVAITVIFGYIGVVLGMLVTQTIVHFFPIMGGATVDMTIASEVLLTLVVCGALAGLFPALRALKIKPVEALRDE